MDAESRRMNPGTPQAFVRIDIPHAAEAVLIEEQRLDTRASGSDQGGKFIESRFERIEADLAKG
jgi:hypothetical protein